MDKKKVIELIQQVIRNNVDSLEFVSDKHNAPLRKANGLLHDALIELGKSDWVSVEDGLPEYGEKVFAYDKEMQDYPFVTMRYKAGKEKLIDKNGFRIGLHVTHWKPIEKLEE